MRVVWKLHKLVWRASGGRLGRRMGGMPTLELTTTGHKFGERRTILIWYLDTGSGPAIVGTNAGASSDPAWVKNLRADPRGEVMIDGGRRPIVARFLDGDEHRMLWDRFKQANDAYAGYETMVTGRGIPIVVLEPAATGSAV